MKNNELKIGTKYWAELQVQSDGKIKVKKAKRLTKINQFTRKWTPTNARNFARVLSQSGLVTK